MPLTIMLTSSLLPFFHCSRLTILPISHSLYPTLSNLCFGDSVVFERTSCKAGSHKFVLDTGCGTNVE